MIGYLSDRLRYRKPILLIFILLTLCSMALILYIPNIPVVYVFSLLFMCGVFSSGQLLTYTFAIECNPIEVKATAVGFVNAMVFLVGSVLQPLIGFFLDLYWNQQMRGGTPIYSPEAYMRAFSWFPLLLIASFLLILFVRESKNHVKATN